MKKAANNQEVAQQAVTLFFCDLAPSDFLIHKICPTKETPPKNSPKIVDFQQANADRCLLVSIHERKKKQPHLRNYSWVAIALCFLRHSRAPLGIFFVGKSRIHGLLFPCSNEDATLGREGFVQCAKGWSNEEREYPTLKLRAGVLLKNDELENDIFQKGLF